MPVATLLFASLLVAFPVSASAATVRPDVPPVPGLCSAPVPADQDTPGCYQTGQLDLPDAPAGIFWHLHQFATPAAAAAEALKHRWATVAQAHSRTWLYVLGTATERIEGGTARAVIGPLHPPAGRLTAHFAESVFPPGMQTRVHSHPGPEAFYVVEGEQCMDGPTAQRRLPAGASYIVEGGPHLQAAPKGRRNLVLILAPAGQPAIAPGGDWQPSDFCSR